MESLHLNSYTTPIERALTRVDTRVDASGQFCPLPVLKAKKALANMNTGHVLHLISTDPESSHDLQEWSRLRGHILLLQWSEGESLHFLIEKGWPQAGASA